MSSIGMMREMTPLLPCRPAILSPGCSLRLTATKTLTCFITPGGNSSPRCSFSTLLSKREVNSATASSICFFKASMSTIRASSRTEICRHWPGVYSASAASAQPLDLGALDRQGALVLVDAAAREHPHLDDRAGDARRQAQRGVAHV